MIELRQIVKTDKAAVTTQNAAWFTKTFVEVSDLTVKWNRWKLIKMHVSSNALDVVVEFILQFLYTEVQLTTLTVSFDVLYTSIYARNVIFLREVGDKTTNN